MSIDLKLVDTIDLIEELSSRSPGHVIALKLNGSAGEYVSKIGIGDILVTGGLLNHVAMSYEMYVQECMYESSEDDAPDA